MENETRETKFIRYCANLCLEAAAPFFRVKKEHPIDEGFIETNALFALALFDAVYEIAPEANQIDDLVPLERQEAVLEKLTRLYWLWNQKGLDEAVREYCSAINDLFAEKALAKAKAGYVLCPDMMARTAQIREQLLSLDQPSKNIIYIDKTSSERKLAL